MFLEAADWHFEITESGFAHSFLLFSGNFTGGDASGSHLSIMASLKWFYILICVGN